ncbi:MAG: aquaporin [Conexivisphaerales archaeon]
MVYESLGKRALAEALGTFLLTFVGAGSSVATYILTASAGESLMIGALANGLALALAVSATMNVSGGNINPAVSLALFLARKISAKTALVYGFCQVGGAIIAAALLKLSLPPEYGNPVAWGTPQLNASISIFEGIVLEAIMTFILIFVVFGTAVDERAPKIGGFGIGLAVTADALVGGPFTGAAMNPAREIGPALISGMLSNWYVYWIGDFIGAAFAAVIYGYIILRHK